MTLIFLFKTIVIISRYCLQALRIRKILIFSIFIFLLIKINKFQELSLRAFGFPFKPCEYVNGAWACSGLVPELALVSLEKVSCACVTGKVPSVFHAEIYAIERYAQFTLEPSDSQAAIKALGSYVIRSKIVWNCRKKLNELDRYNKISLFWIPGQLGKIGNETADELIKRGSASPFGPDPSVESVRKLSNMCCQSAQKSVARFLWKQIVGDFISKQALRSAVPSVGFSLEP